jgi:hypothetical protein
MLQIDRTTRAGATARTGRGGRVVGRKYPGVSTSSTPSGTREPPLIRAVVAALQWAARRANGLQPLAARVRHAAHHTPATGCALLSADGTVLQPVATICGRLQQTALRCNRSRCVAPRCAALQQVRLRHGRLHCVATGCCVVVRSAVATRDAPLQRMGNRIGCVVARTMLSAVASTRCSSATHTGGQGASRAMDAPPLTRHATRSAAACARYRASSSVACACTRTHSGMRALPRL